MNEFRPVSSLIIVNLNSWLIAIYFAAVLRLRLKPKRVSSIGELLLYDSIESLYYLLSTSLPAPLFSFSLSWSWQSQRAISKRVWTKWTNLFLASVGFGFIFKFVILDLTETSVYAWGLSFPMKVGNFSPNVFWLTKMSLKSHWFLKLHLWNQNNFDSTHSAIIRHL
jgi:hypothetical protein